MKPNALNLEDYAFIQKNERVFTTAMQSTPELRKAVTDIYNRITGKNARPNSCGRCWTNTKQEVYAVYLKQKAGLI